MADYCTVAEVQTEFKSIDFGSDEAVKTATVDTFIDQATAEIDAVLSPKYVVPITAGASALLLLKQICIWLVAQRIKDIVEVKTVRTDVAQDVKTDTATKARKMLQDIASGKIVLIGATLSGTTNVVHKFTSSTCRTRTFHKNRNEW